MTEYIEHVKLHWTDNLGINFLDNIRKRLKQSLLKANISNFNDTYKN